MRSMVPAGLTSLLATILAAGGCSSPIGGGGGGAGGGGTDPNKPGLAFAMSPMDAIMKAPFDLYVRINDKSGNPVSTDNTTAVTVRLEGGGGALGGTLTRTAAGGIVHFDDLRYDRWESIKLAVGATGFKDATTPPFPVRPIMRMADPPSFRVKTGNPIGPITLELVDGDGQIVVPRSDQKVTLASTDAGAAFDGGADRTFKDGRATWDRVTLKATGGSTLMWSSDGLATLMQGVVVYDMLRTESVWLPGGRVGVDYSGKLPGGGKSYELVGGALQKGLKLAADGAISGKPTESRHARLEVVSTDAGGAFTLWLANLSIFPEVETPAKPLDAVNADGPYAVGTLDDTVNVTSRSKTEKIRIYYPAEGGKPAAGKFPLVVFHHGAAGIDGGHPKIYDRYDPLLKRWASRGFVVVTIDGVDLIFMGSMGTYLSLANITGMSENQRATIELMKQKNEDGSWLLGKHIDVDRIIVSGHSRGGGGSTITTRTNPEVLGAILLKPIDPMMAMGGETSWNKPLPAKPFLINIAGNDADVFYPICDFMYERRSSLMAAHTIVGTAHNYTKSVSGAVCAPEMGSNPTIKREEDWAITNAYAISFLEYVGHGDLAYAPMLFGREGLSTGLSPLGSYNRGDRAASPLLIDDFQDGDPGKNVLGKSNGATGFSSAANEPSMKKAIGSIPSMATTLRSLYSKPENLAFSNALTLAWSADGATFKTELGSLDVRGRGAFVFRARADSSKLAASVLKLRFTDAVGKSAMLDGTEYVGKNGIGTRFSDVVVPVSEIKGAGADVSKLASFELVLSGSGTIAIDDLRFE